MSSRRLFALVLSVTCVVPVPATPASLSSLKAARMVMTPPAVLPAFERGNAGADIRPLSRIDYGAISAIAQLRVLGAAYGAHAPMALPVARPQEINPPDFPSSDPVAEGIDPVALKKLLDRADEEHSDAVLILRNGKVVAAKGAWDQKIYAMSATKSVASLAVGALIEDGMIRSLDQPVSDFIPEWRTGEKSQITVRMLLNHTSGLNTGGRGATYALKAPLVYPPGSAFAYNNPAVDLLALVIEKASGATADAYMARRIFEPLGITDVDWEKDESGYPLTAGELMIRPVDFAKIGQMVLDGGVWKGRQIISKSWLDLSAEPSQPFDPTCGLLWWRDAEIRAIGLTSRLLETYRRVGVRTEVIEPLRALLGRRMKDSDELWAALRTTYRDHLSYLEELNDMLMRNRLPFYEVVELAPSEGFSAQGFLGQYLVVDPKRRLVGLRMRHSRPSDYPTPENPKPPDVDTFNDFTEFVHRLAPAQ